ncbi:MAG: hypothetical protein A3G32_01845 [Deltaproteobacteria bacterium RIFCSPLOWO2_12_FULL_40_28]|nr:MAG: hypothetical protein A3C45_06590 [Deltaproteobacteria bacterium RIFCSPHIGHO2_02_FULL_40_28]OGQ18873.1 MAG: hypothetical protein A3E27_09225 [Deltaproteobacteria bacterium RIFCSPHIGHO2_12_FULL_40_32]OGQ40118.1 MAG: hypothetical protein A3I69_01755 [Deltaproteobacteria bacterium RIFCSPLOWO2_02_FULL_40_36]OGQ53301.1 MAG: hypothetical protein A3G32_01845 [Deltaproteobacteria bacterium RIFCSPLOWO2_12_FULL_40_28]
MVLPLLWLGYVAAGAAIVAISGCGEFAEDSADDTAGTGGTGDDDATPQDIFVTNNPDAAAGLYELTGPVVSPSELNGVLTSGDHVYFLPDPIATETEDETTYAIGTTGSYHVNISVDDKADVTLAPYSSASIVLESGTEDGVVLDVYNSERISVQGLNFDGRTSGDDGYVHHAAVVVRRDGTDDDVLEDVLVPGDMEYDLTLEDVSIHDFARPEGHADLSDDEERGAVSVHGTGASLKVVSTNPEDPSYIELSRGEAAFAGEGSTLWLENVNLVDSYDFAPSVVAANGANAVVLHSVNIDGNVTSGSLLDISAHYYEGWGIKVANNASYAEYGLLDLELLNNLDSDYLDTSSLVSAEFVDNFAGSVAPVRVTSVEGNTFDSSNVELAQNRSITDYFEASLPISEEITAADSITPFTNAVTLDNGVDEGVISLHNWQISHMLVEGDIISGLSDSDPQNRATIDFSNFYTFGMTDDQVPESSTGNLFTEAPVWQNDGVTLSIADDGALEATPDAFTPDASSPLLYAGDSSASTEYDNGGEGTDVSPISGRGGEHYDDLLATDEMNYALTDRRNSGRY